MYTRQLHLEELTDEQCRVILTALEATGHHTLALEVRRQSKTEFMPTYSQMVAAGLAG